MTDAGCRPKITWVPGRRGAACGAAQSQRRSAATSSDLSLALSLLFGVAQVAAGAAVARVIVRRRGWREMRLFVLLLIAAWFVCSGLAELAVSGGETARRVWGAPSAAVLAAVKARADAVLLAATIVLFVCLLAYPLVRQHTSGTSRR